MLLTNPSTIDAAKILSKPSVQYEYNKEDEMECGCSGKRLKDRAAKKGASTDYIGRLQRDLASSFYWSGNCCKDYAFFIANWHPFFGMFLSHPAHPWSKTERFSMFIFSCCLSMPASAVFVHYMSPEDLKLDTWREFWTMFFCITLPVMIWETAMYWLAIGDIYCKGRGYTGICDCCSAACRCCKNCCFCCSVVFSLIAAGISVYLMKKWDSPYQELLYPFVYSRVQSWLTWFPIWTFLPCIGFLWAWNAEKAANSKGSRGIATVEEDEYDYEDDEEEDYDYVEEDEDYEDEKSSCVVT